MQLSAVPKPQVHCLAAAAARFARRYIVANIDLTWVPGVMVALLVGEANCWGMLISAAAHSACLPALQQHPTCHRCRTQACPHFASLPALPTGFALQVQGGARLPGNRCAQLRRNLGLVSSAS